MQRRQFLSLALAATLAPALPRPAAAATSALERSWQEAPHPLRRQVKAKLALSELYFGELDSRWSRATDRGLRRAADLVAQKDGTGQRPELHHNTGVRAFLAGLAEGRFDHALLKPEAPEGDGFGRWFEDHFTRS
ncbi:MAG: hypothetical protein R3E47_00095 [Paracoccaceae bacterium]|jgi:hypothetical protein